MSTKEYIEDSFKTVLNEELKDEPCPADRDGFTLFLAYVFLLTLCRIQDDGKLSQCEKLGVIARMAQMDAFSENAAISEQDSIGDLSDYFTS